MPSTLSCCFPLQRLNWSFPPLVDWDFIAATFSTVFVFSTKDCRSAAVASIVCQILMALGKSKFSVSSSRLRILSLLTPLISTCKMHNGVVLQLPMQRHSLLLVFATLRQIGPRSCTPAGAVKTYPALHVRIA